MPAGTPNRLPVMALILTACIVSTVSAASLGLDWKQNPLISDNRFSGVSLTPDASRVFSGGSQLLVRSWDDTFHWGGAAGFVAAMSDDGRYIAGGSGNTVTLYNRTGQQIWSRNMNGQIQSVAVSAKGSFVIASDNLGNYHSWAPNGDYYGMNKTDELVKQLAIAPTEDFFVVTTMTGMRYYSPSLKPLWTDSRQGSLDDYIVISDDGQTIITAGGTRLSSHTKAGVLNWQTEVTDAAINDLACNEDCSIIITGSQDNVIRAIDRYGKIHWEFNTGQWANAVATSRSGNVIAAGANDGTLYILDHSGSLLTKRKFDSRIQPRSLAVSGNGTRIAVADLHALYGLYLMGLDGDTSDTTFVAAQLNPVVRTPTLSPTTSPPEVTMPEEARPTPIAVPVTTRQSPLDPGTLLPALAGSMYALWKKDH